MEPNETAATAPVASATVIVAREQAGALEVLMLRRAESMRFVGGMWVFPGGRVDEEDLAAARQAAVPAELRRRWSGRFHTLGGATLDERDTVALHLAAARETQEESGLRLAVSELVYFGHWITPTVSPQRFDTHFFVAALPEGQSVALDERESSAHAWVSPEEALSGTGVADALPPPTYMTLRDLAASHRRHGSFAALLRAETARDVPPILPLVNATGQVWDMLMPWDAEYARVAGATGMPRSWPRHVLDLPSRLTFEGRRMRLAPSVVEDQGR